MYQIETTIATISLPVNVSSNSCMSSAALKPVARCRIMLGAIWEHRAYSGGLQLCCDDSNSCGAISKQFITTIISCPQGLQASWALRLERLIIDCCLGGLITVIAAAVDHHAWVGLHEQLSWMGWCSTNPSITHSNNQIHLAIGMNGGCFTHPIRIVAAPLC